MITIHTFVRKFDTSVSHMLNCLFTNCDKRLVSSNSESWRVPYVGQKMLTVSGTPNFTHFGELLISPIHYIYTCITEFVNARTMFVD